MLTRRIIPCLDVNNGRVVKGVNFVNLIDAGDPVETAKAYSEEGADELVFLDITATHENRGTILDVVAKTAEQVFIPFAVGGGIRTLEDISAILKCGADKISLNSVAVTDPDLINRSSEKFGSQCIICAIDVKAGALGKYEVYINGGRINTGKEAVAWAQEVERRGAGEILLTSMDTDGTKAGYDIDITSRIADAVKIPVIASGGAGKLEDFYNAFTAGKASAALAASLFHFKELTIKQVKEYLKSRNIAVRI